MQNAEEKIVYSRRGSIACISLNRCKALNALDLDMIRSIEFFLRECRSDASISAVFLDSACERAFCAGGDVRKLAEGLLADRGGKAAIEQASEYFSAEFFVDYAIHVFPKPIVVWSDKITMGGGIGLFAGASHRVVTPDSLLAMPEISIGYFPDVGSTWYLNRMPQNFGIFLGITGARFSGADALALGLATHCIPSVKKAQVLEKLEAMKFSFDPAVDRARITHCLRAFSEEPRAKIMAHGSTIRNLFRGDDFMAFHGNMLALETGEDAWLEETKKNYLAGAPSSRRVIFEQMRRGRELPKRDVFEFEWILATNFAIHADFAEGIRSVLIDKDKSPRWAPDRVEDIDEKFIDAFFEMPRGFSENPLRKRLREL